MVFLVQVEEDGRLAAVALLSGFLDTSGLDTPAGQFGFLNTFWSEMVTPAVVFGFLNTVRSELVTPAVVFGFLNTFWSELVTPAVVFGSSDNSWFELVTELLSGCLNKYSNGCCVFLLAAPGLLLFGFLKFCPVELVSPTWVDVAHGAPPELKIQIEK